MRHCGDCQLCCKVLPVKPRDPARTAATRAALVERGVLDPRARHIPEFDKPAGCRCPYQKHHKGCVVYDRRPLSCALWNCRWLTEDDTASMPRPDRAHYVIDIMPDFITVTDHDTGRKWTQEIVQIWLDPGYPEAHRDPHLRAYLARRVKEGKIGLVRLDSARAFILVAPEASSTRQWFEGPVLACKTEHSAREIAQVLGSGAGAAAVAGSAEAG